MFLVLQVLSIYLAWDVYQLHVNKYCQSLIAVAMVLYGTIDSLIEFFSFTAWIFYGGAMLALIVMRYTKPHAPRPYKVHDTLTGHIWNRIAS